jgi:transposase
MPKSTRSPKIKPASLSQLNPKCAGVDIGAAEIFVCIAKNASEQEVRSFPTFTADLKRLISWLKENKVKSVAMESTGVYWIPLYEMLEEAGFEVLLVNARIFRNVPGRKSDVQDCQWIQQLHSYGLLRGSFRPTEDIVEFRTYVRQRRRLFKSAAQQDQLMQKALVQMNIQITHAIRDITGQTGLNIIRAILKGERDPVALAKLRHPACKNSEDTIAKALEGNYKKEHLLSLKQSYEGYEFFHQQILECEQAILEILKDLQDGQPIIEEISPEPAPSKKKGKGRLKTDYNRTPYHFHASPEIQKVTKVDLTTIPGIDASSAMSILSEIGTDMSCWSSAKAFCSWLGLCPGNKVSGGKNLSSKTKPTNNKVAHTLRNAASTLYNAKSYLGAFFRRMRSRLGAPKAITATAHKLARIIYSMLSTGKNYHDLGEKHYEEQHRQRVVENLKRRSKELGFTLTPIVA